MKFQILNNEQIEFYDEGGNLKATINVSNDDLVIEPAAPDGNIVFGENTVRDVEIGSVSTPAKLDFLGGGTITSNGNTLYLGDANAGDNVIISGVQVATNYFSTGSLTLTDTLYAQNLSSSMKLTVEGNATIGGTLTAGYLGGDGSAITNLVIANSDMVARSITTPVRMYNPFQGALSNRYFDGIQTNRFHGRQNVLYMSVDDGDLILAKDIGNYAALFDGNYDSQLQFDANTTHSIYLDFTSSGAYYGGSGITYPEGQIHVTFYAGRSWESATLTHYYSSGPGVTNTFTMSDPISDTAYNASYVTVQGNNYLRAVKIDFVPRENVGPWITQIEYHGTRMTYGESGNFTKTGGYIRYLDPDIVSLPTSDPGINGYMFTTASQALGLPAGHKIVLISQG